MPEPGASLLRRIAEQNGVDEFDPHEAWVDLRLGELFDEEDRDRIQEAASSRAESPAAFVRDGVLEFAAETLGDEDGHLECRVEDCEETFTSERRRRGHVGRVHSDNLPEGEFWCGVCGYGPTTYPGVAAHSGQRHTGEEVRPLDHEPDDNELLAPDDVPDHMDRELLERLYDECDGSYTEMCRRHDFEVVPGRVRHYLIEYGIHEPTPQGTDGDVPPYRDRDWFKERYDAAGGNLAEMHRNLEVEVPYRTLVKNVKRFDFHDVDDPPGKRHGKGGPKPAAADEPDGAGEDDVDEEPAEVHGTGGDLPPEEQAFVLDEFPWPPWSGTYHMNDECWTLHRSDSDQEPVPLPWTRSELETDDDWSECGHCAKSADDVDGRDPVEEAADGLGPLYVDEPDDLRLAYRETDSIAAAAEAFPDATYGIVRQYLIDAGIHVPESREPPGSESKSKPSALTDDVDEAATAGGDEPADEGPPIEWDFPPGFTTVSEQVERSSDRLVEESICSRCGEPYAGGGVCPACADGLETDLVTDGGRPPGGSRR